LAVSCWKRRRARSKQNLPKIWCRSSLSQPTPLLTPNELLYPLQVTPQPHIPLNRARTLPALSSLSHAPGHRGALDWKEEDEPDPAASPASTPTRLLCIPKPSLRHSRPKHRPVTSLCSVRCAPRAPRACICVPSRVAPETLFPSRTRSRGGTCTLTHLSMCPFVYHTAHACYQTPVATDRSPPSLLVLANSAHSRRPRWTQTTMPLLIAPPDRPIPCPTSSLNRAHQRWTGASIKLDPSLQPPTAPPIPSLSLYLNHSEMRDTASFSPLPS
jgi:hypothetical protein